MTQYNLGIKCYILTAGVSLISLAKSFDEKINCFFHVVVVCITFGQPLHFIEQHINL